MTNTPFQTVGPEGPYRNTTEEAFAAWRIAVPVLGVVETVEELVCHLRGAASQRRPDPLLSGLGRLTQLKETGDEALDLYFAGFTAELMVLAEAVVRRTGADVASSLDMARQVLINITTGSIFLGEEQSGRSIMSRTWAATFFVVHPGEHRSWLLAELTAGYYRAAAAFRAMRLSLAHRSIINRVTGRLAPLTEVRHIARKDGEETEEFDAHCRRMGIWPFLARRQLKIERERAPFHDRAMRELEVAVAVASEELFFTHLDNQSEPDGDGDEPRAAAEADSPKMPGAGPETAAANDPTNRAPGSDATDDPWGKK